MKHCPSCTCHAIGLKATERAMSRHHVVAPCCGEVTTPKLIRKGQCEVCRQHQSNQPAMQAFRQRKLQCVGQ